MKRKLAILLSAIMAFGTMSSVFALSKYQEVGNKLKSYGIIQGQDDGDLNEFSKLTREQAIVILIRMLGKENEAKSTLMNSGFKDVPSNNFYAPYISYARLINLTNGISENEFGFKKEVSTKEIATYFLRILKHTADWKTEDIMQKSKGLGILKDVSSAENESVIRGEVFVMLDNTLNQVPVGEKQTLAQKLNFVKDVDKEDNKTENKKPIINSSTFELVNIKSDNLKEIEVEFSQDLDANSIKNAFRIDGGNTGTIITELLQDGRTVRITTTNLFERNRKYVLNISNLLSNNLNKIESLKKEFNVVDYEPPIIDEIKIVGPKNLQLVFNEPINYKNSQAKIVKIKSGSNYISSTISENSNNRIVDIRLNSNMLDGAVYSIESYGFVDYAGYPLIYNTKDVQYSKLNSSPMATIDKATPEYVVVKFNRPVKGLTLDNFYHEFSVYKPMAAYKSLEDYSLRRNKLSNNFSNTFVDELVLQFADAQTFGQGSAQYPLRGNERFYILNELNGRKVLDAWDNQLEAYMSLLNIEVNDEKPEVRSVSLVDEKRVEIIFSKDVDAKISNFEIYDKFDKKMNVSLNLESSKGRKITLAINSPKMEGKEIKLVIKDVVDNTISKNKMENKYIENILFTDKTFDGVDEVILTETQYGGIITIAYREPVRESTALDLSNYKLKLGNNYSQLEGSISMKTDRVVEVEIFKETLNKIKLSSAALVVSDGVKDLNGNGFNVFSKEFEIKKTGTSAKLDVNNLPVLEEDTSGQYIKLTFDSKLNADIGIRANDQFEVSVLDRKLSVSYAEFLDDSQKVIKVYLADKAPVDAKDLKIAVKPLSLSNGGLYNDKNIITNVAPTEVMDKIAPKLEKFSFNESKPRILFDINTNSIELTFNEKMDGNLRYMPEKIVPAIVDFTTAAYGISKSEMDIEDVTTSDYRTYNVKLKINNAEEFKKSLELYMESSGFVDISNNNGKYYRLFNIKLNKLRTRDIAGNVMTELIDEELPVYFVK